MIPNTAGTVDGGKGFSSKSQATSLTPFTFMQSEIIPPGEDMENESIDQVLMPGTSDSFIDVQEKAIRIEMPQKVRSALDSIRGTGDSLGISVAVTMGASFYLPVNQEVENSARQVASQGVSSTGGALRDKPMPEESIPMQRWVSSPNASSPGESTKHVPDKLDTHLNTSEPSSPDTQSLPKPVTPSQAFQSKKNVPPVGGQNGKAESVDGQKLPMAPQEARMVEVQDSGPPNPTVNSPGADPASGEEIPSSKVFTQENSDKNGSISTGDEVDSTKQRLVEPGGGTVGGIPDAKRQVPMKETVEMDEMTRHSRQEVPSEPISAVTRESGRKAQSVVKKPADSESALPGNMPATPAAVHLPQAESASDKAVASAQSWDRVAEVVQAQAVQMKRVSATTVDAVIRPDHQTELHLRMHWNGTQMEAQLCCERGHTEILQQHWEQLRDSLAAKGIVLTAWQPGRNLGNGSSAGDRRKSSHSTVNAGAGDDGAATIPTHLTRTEAIAHLRSRQWETWA